MLYRAQTQPNITKLRLRFGLEYICPVQVFVGATKTPTHVELYRQSMSSRKHYVEWTRIRTTTDFPSCPGGIACAVAQQLHTSKRGDSNARKSERSFKCISQRVCTAAHYTLGLEGVPRPLRLGSMPVQYALVSWRPFFFWRGGHDGRVLLSMAKLIVTLQVRLGPTTVPCIARGHCTWMAA